MNEELARARAREAATREILEVISQSRDDERPVFDVILRHAADLCGAHSAALALGKAGDSHQRLLAHRGVSPATVEVYKQGKVSMNPDISPTARAILTGKVIHIPDMMDTDGYRSGIGVYVSVVRDTGVRTEVMVPLVTPAGGIGCIIVFRKEVRPFTPEEIALVETFATQAVIAIENVRQFRELQDSLEKQEATSDILRVISQSREDEAQVFDLVLDKATVLCGADQGSLFIVNEARTHIRLLADWGHDRTTYRPGLEFSLDLPLSLVATIRTGKMVHIEDYAQSDAYRDRDPIAVELVEIEGVRTRLNVPLLQNGIAIGCISLSRRVVRAFTLPEIQLVETFAAQAVIAIENVRQFRENCRRALRARRRRGRSSRSSARAATMTARCSMRCCAMRTVCVAPAWPTSCSGDPRTTYMTLAAYVNPYVPSENGVDEIIAFANQTGMRMDAAEHFSARAIVSGEVVQIADLARSQGYLSGEPTTRILVEDVGVRTILSVPLFDAQGAIGAISLQRREERLFSDDEITLIQSFAAQAVIAIENVRQFRAIQTANAELEPVGAGGGDAGNPRGHQPEPRRRSARCSMRSCATRPALRAERRRCFWDKRPRHICRMVAIAPDAQSKTLRDHRGKQDRWPMRMNPTDPVAARRRSVGAGRPYRRSGPNRKLTVQTTPPVRLMVDDIGLRTILSVPLIHGHRAGSAALSLFGERCGPFDQRDRAWWKPSPPRPSSPSRTSASSRRWRR